jgi:hypothetical protein
MTKIENHCLGPSGHCDRPGLIREENIKMDHKIIGFEGLEWDQLAQDRMELRPVVNTVMNLQVS